MSFGLRTADVLPSVQWIPLVTFLQVSADMAVAVDVPDGHGHSDDKTDRLRLLPRPNQ